MEGAFFATWHDETLALLFEARRYIQNLQLPKKVGAGAVYPTKNADSLDLSRETMRLTSRLTQVMAWVLAQQAVAEGEITAQEGVSEPFGLSGQSVCLENDLSSSGHLPEQLRDLLWRSRDLYLRVDRLEAQIRSRLGEESFGQRRDPEKNTSTMLRLIPATTSGQDPRNAY